MEYRDCHAITCNLCGIKATGSAIEVIIITIIFVWTWEKFEKKKTRRTVRRPPCAPPVTTPTKRSLENPGFFLSFSENFFYTIRFSVETENLRNGYDGKPDTFRVPLLSLLLFSTPFMSKPLTCFFFSINVLKRRLK